MDSFKTHLFQSNNNFLEKIISFSDYMEWKTFIESNCIDNVHTIGKSFSRLLLLKVCESFLLRHSTQSWSALWSAGVFLEKTTKWTLFMRSKFSFLHLDIYLDVPKFELSLKNSSLKCWMCSGLVLWRTQK